jgi:hypothetical protein
MQQRRAIQFVYHRHPLITLQPTPTPSGCAAALTRGDQMMTRADGLSISLVVSGLEL